MQYKHSSLEFKDWRLPEHRMEGFLKWLKWRMRYFDLDHYGCNNAYRDATGSKSPTGAPMTKEQQLWFSLIFGTTYQSEMAWAIYWSMPNLEKINLTELKQWNDDTYEKQRYAKDCKYNKGRIVEQVQSIQGFLERHGSLENWIKEKQVDEFDSIYKEVLSLHKFGRMTSWITCQVLFETAEVNVFPDTLLATDPSNWSVRSGLMYLYDRMDKIESLNKDVKIDDEDRAWILTKEKELFDLSMEVLDERDKPIFSYYLLESHLCQYKKLMLGGDYAGHSSGDHFSRGTVLKELWPQVNYSPFFDEVVPHKHNKLVAGKHESKALRNLCKITGQMINMHQDFDDFPDMYKELGISSSDLEDDQEIMIRINDYMNGDNKSTLEGFFQ